MKTRIIRSTILSLLFLLTLSVIETTLGMYFAEGSFLEQIQCFVSDSKCFKKYLSIGMPAFLEFLPIYESGSKRLEFNSEYFVINLVFISSFTILIELFIEKFSHKFRT